MFGGDKLNDIIYDKVGQRLKLARENKKITLEQAGERVGVHKSTVLRWESGETKKINLTIIESLADFYSVNPAWLSGHDVPIENKTNNGIVENISSAIVFVYGTIPAGIPMECIQDIIDTEEIPANWLKGGKQFFGLKIKGTSMSPTYLDGDTIILEKVDNCESGQDAVVMVNGYDGTFKRVFKNENGIILQPLNPEFQPMVYSNEQIESLPVRIIGVAREIRRKI